MTIFNYLRDAYIAFYEYDSLFTIMYNKMKTKISLISYSQYSVSSLKSLAF